jgi:hypothetical protein
MAAIAVRRLVDNERHIAGTRRAAAFVGPRVALVVSEPDDGGAASEAGAAMHALVALLLAEPEATASLVRDLELLLLAFDACVGKAPPVRHGLEGRVRVECDFLEGAAGLAHHGAAGFAIGPAFVRDCVRARAAGVRQLDHVFTYECCRNYIFPDEFTPLFESCLAPGAVAVRLNSASFSSASAASYAVPSTSASPIPTHHGLPLACASRMCARPSRSTRSSSVSCSVEAFVTAQ